MSADIVTLRPATADDMAYINAYSTAEGMDVIPSVEGITVAVNDEDIPVGFIRLNWADGVAYVEPIVVCETWRGHGVGRVMIEDALNFAGELRLVARGESVAFYERLGFVPIEWDEIAPGVTEDCTDCPYVPQCQPQPMRWIK